MTDALKYIVGEENVSEKKADLIAYSYDASELELTPAYVVWPSSEDEVRQIILYCNRINMPIIPRGCGTNTIGGAVGSNALILDLSRMTQSAVSTSLKEADVGPGTILMHLNAAVARVGLSFPIQPYFGSFCTIGGMAAMNALGPRSLRYGRMNNCIKTIEYLDGTGKHYTLKTDLDRIVGMEGTVGIITRIVLSLTDTPESTASIIAFSSEKDLLAAVPDLKGRKDVLAIDYLNTVASAATGLPAAHHLIVEYSSSRGDIKDLADVQSTLRKRDVLDSLRLKGYYHTEDVSASDLTHIVAWGEEDEIPVFGPIGLHTLFLMFKKNEPALFTALYDRAAKGELALGTVSGYGITKKEFVSAELRKTLIKLKEEHDYNNILNRGKIIDFR